MHTQTFGYRVIVGTFTSFRNTALIFQGIDVQVMGGNFNYLIIPGIIILRYPFAFQYRILYRSISSSAQVQVTRIQFLYAHI